MKMIKEMPKEGQFIVIWEYNNKLWSETYEWENNELYHYDSIEDEYIIINDLFFIAFNPNYITKE